MKYIKLFIVVLISVFSVSMNVLAESSNFEPFLSMATDITENQIRVALGFSGEEVMAIKETLAYDSNKLTLVEVEALDNFTVSTSTEKVDGKYRTIEILADSDYSFTESNYAVLVFEVKGNFKTKNKSDIFLYSYTASGPDKIKYRSKGVIATLNRVSLSEMNFVQTNITDSTKTKYWLINHIYVFVIIGAIIIGVVVIILLLPSRRKKEVREKTTEDLLKAENYDPSSAGIKIDPKAIEAIGKVEKPIDMSQAIIVNEEVKPFGDIVGKYDNEEIKQPEEIKTNINIFDAKKPEDVANLIPENNTINETASVNNTQAENASSGTSINGFDPFHATINETNTQDSNVIKETPQVETLEVKGEGNANKQNEELAVINPQTFETVEMPKLSEDVNIGNNAPQNNENNQNNNSNTPNILSIIFLLLIISSISITSVFAEESFHVKDLRDCIVGKAPFDKDLDYNNDGKIDVLDIIETKDLANCSFENLLSTDPGFAEIHGQSNNLISSDSNFVAPTKKRGGILKKEKTTTLKTTKNTTAKGDSGSSSSSSLGFRTTNERTTKEATTKGETTKRTTAAKPGATTYTVSINATNGQASPSSFEIEAGKSKTIPLSSNAGYTINKTASSCSNISYSFNGINKLVLANPTGNAVCNLVFSANGNIKVTLKYSIGKGNSDTITPSYSYSTKSVDNGGNGVYNEKWSTGVATPTGYKLAEGPSCGTYSNGVFSITIPSEAKTCTMTFHPIMYNLKVFLSGQSSPINTGTLARVFYDEKKKITFDSYTQYTSVSCPSGTASRLSRSGKGPYTYSFYYTHTSTSDATCNIS